MKAVISTYCIRLWLIPFLQALVWFASLCASIFYDFGGVFPNVYSVFKIILAITVALGLDVMLTSWDLKLQLEGFLLNLNHKFKLQLCYAPFIVYTIAFIPAYIYYKTNWSLILIFIVLSGLKFISHYSCVFVDKNKIPDIGSYTPI